MDVKVTVTGGAEVFVGVVVTTDVTAAVSGGGGEVAADGEG